MKTQDFPKKNRKNTIRGVVIGMTAIIIGVYCFREQIPLFALNSTCSDQLSDVNTIKEEKLEFYTFPLIQELSNKWKSEYGLEVRGVGSGGTYGWNLLNISYHRDNSLEIDEARALLIQCTSELLDKINEHEKLLPRMQNHPFTANNLRLSINFGGQYQFPPKGQLSNASVHEGNLLYFTHDHEIGAYGRSVLLLKETYDEALNIIAQSPAPATTVSDSSLTASAD